MEQKPNFEQLFSRYLNHQATANELQSLFNVMNELSDDSLSTYIGEELALEEELVKPQPERLKGLFTQIEEKISAPPKTKVISMTSWYKVAAVVALAFGLGYMVFDNSPSKRMEIVPGSSKAVLVVNEKKIPLHNQKATYFSASTAVKVTTAADGTITYQQLSNDTAGLSTLHTISTPAGGFYKVTLSDGTKVYLNSKSTLAFPVGFYGAQRHVKLKGEAYFKVAENKQMPFIVSVEGTNVKVLGTEFVINSFGKQTKTTLFKGSVQLQYLSNRKILAPGQEGLSERNGILVNEADTAASLAWTNGLFVFNDQPLTSVLRELSRWYDFSFDEHKVPNKQLYIRLNRNTAFADVLQMLNTTTGLNFKIEERRLSIEN